MSFPKLVSQPFTIYSPGQPLPEPMAKARAIRVQRRVLAATLLAACFGVSVTAQDAAPETPPELKDFRLDTPPPKEKAPEPAPAPVVTPQAQPKADTPRAERAPQRPAAQPAPREEDRSEAAEPASELQPQTEAPALLPEPLPQSEAPTEAEPVTAEPDSGGLISTLLSLWPIFAALLALLAGWLAFRWFANRQRDSLEGIESINAPAAAPTIPRPTPSPRPVSRQPIAARGSLSASFEPSDARLSMANLTITGCLRLRYDGPEALQSLRLRNLVISASEGQRSVIDAFHNDPHAGQIDTLGGIQPGEEIVLTLELQVPRDGLQAFDWRERRFVAPILLLNLSSDDPSITPCRIACLVGQEGDPQSPRMQPLPIDRGPRHFAALRFSPIAA
jgi:hypothetical protein